MNTRESSPSFGHSLGAALLLSLSGAAVLAALTPMLSTGTALRAVIALLGLAYVLYVLGRSGERVGRITTIACWALVASVAWFAGLPLVGYLLVHLGLVWLIRSLYCYSGVLPALADLGVTALGAAFAVWAARYSGSAWLAFWCFFLAQTLHGLIPAAAAGRNCEAPNEADQAFDRAHRAAEAAIRRLSTAR
jgi:hypothetical protein